MCVHSHTNAQCVHTLTGAHTLTLSLGGGESREELPWRPESQQSTGGAHTLEQVVESGPAVGTWWEERVVGGW